LIDRADLTYGGDVVVPGTDAGPPAFVRLAGHPLRWRLLTLLAGGDHRVRELAAVLGQPQNLVSYHLRLLRCGGLVTATRSAFDGRDSYYHLELDRCADAMAATGAALHPALGPAWAGSAGSAGSAAAAGPAAGRRRIAVLFVCTGNTARSPVAEALLRHHGGDRVYSASAGTHPGRRLHPDAAPVLREAYGIDLADRRPRSVTGVARRRFDHVITLCDRAREACPEIGRDTRRAHWSIPDPAADPGGLRRTVTEIDTRVRHLVPALTGPTPSARPPGAPSAAPTAAPPVREVPP
jgi:ArsR family transcriptional regulator, arsenate/arsenite/antimonite-responsive transcriptional repressor / arsenate reductase (thioredoxin)